MHSLTQKEYQDLLLEHNNFKHCINDLENRLRKCESQQEAMSSLTRSVDRLAMTMGTLVEEHKGLKKDIKALKEEPLANLNHYKRTIISCTITAVIGAIIGAVMSLILA